MIRIIIDTVLFSCMGAFNTGIVVAAAYVHRLTLETADNSVMGATVCCSSVAEQPWRVHAFVAPRVPTGEFEGPPGTCSVRRPTSGQL